MKHKRVYYRSQFDKNQKRKFAREMRKINKNASQIQRKETEGVLLRVNHKIV